MEIVPLGDSALIVRVIENFADDPDASLNAVLAALRRLENAAIPGVIELAPAYTTVALFYDPARIETDGPATSPFDALKTRIENILAGRSMRIATAAMPRTVEIPVCYDAEFALDLDHVAAHVGLPAAELIRRHANAPYRVACVGFIAGFPFLSGLPRELATPRRAAPRKEIPAGSVAIGGAQTGVYPRKSPGGWNVIGRTPLRLFDVQRKPPPLLQAGDRVRFREISREEFDTLSR
ncbi:MAG: kinase inhibitor [Chthoniobacterales bacterium]|nr:MAG: kinase inhibitor [Chthoniobacterales bacterium]